MNKIWLDFGIIFAWTFGLVGGLGGLAGLSADEPENPPLPPHISTETVGGEEASDGRLRVLFVDGVHGYDEPAMARLLAKMGRLYHFQRATFPEDRGILKPGLEKRFDVIVFYDQDQTALAPQEMADFNQLLERGIGVIALHHHLGAHSDQPDFWRTMGGYYVRPDNKSFTGRDVPTSSWTDRVPMKIHRVRPEHPILEGIEDFEITDEAYLNAYVSPEAEVLLTTDSPLASPEIGWLWRAGNSCVFTFLLGHDDYAFAHPAFQKILENAIGFTAGESRQIKDK